jgi:hypothetical protein
VSSAAVAKAFNPLDKRNLGQSVAAALLDQPLDPLPPETSFTGAGIYAIYYAGAFAAYTGLGSERPIYVGKAVPPGARTGRFGLDTDPGTALFGRLSEHARSIDQAENLDLKDFRCRYLLTDDIWIPLGESLLIQMMRPPWNLVVDGFGNHDPGAGRAGQQRSAWDELHPGRSWARLLREGRSAAEVEAAVRDYLAGRPTEVVPLEKAIEES